MRSILFFAAVVCAIIPTASAAVVHNEEYIPRPYDAYAEIIVEAAVEAKDGRSFTGTFALYDRAIMVEREEYTKIAYVPILAGTVIEKMGRNTTRITTPDDKVYEGEASTRNGSIVLVCKRLEPDVDTRMIINLQAKYNYVSGVEQIERMEIHRVLEDEYVERWSPAVGSPPGDGFGGLTEADD
ncbi:MAG: hypothetical protein JSW52_08165 [Candidatus Coatesbacteria bacterium]|nr:MAG: hypothetical protein JSW52_08165 [Candidatus Coatesbacteria bacterium]